jgi:hypothetical protein
MVNKSLQLLVCALIAPAARLSSGGGALHRGGGEATP